jgi:hypothetical protein
MTQSRRVVLTFPIRMSSDNIKYKLYYYYFSSAKLGVVKTPKEGITKGGTGSFEKL